MFPIDGMPTTNQPAPHGPRARALRPGLILLLGLLPPMVGLSRHIGLNEALGPGGGPLLLVALVTVVWVAVVGGGRMARPVATLTLAGVTAALYQIAVRTVLLLGDGEETFILLIGIVPILLIQTLWGFLAGLLAHGVQRLRGVGR